MKGSNGVTIAAAIDAAIAEEKAEWEALIQVVPSLIPIVESASTYRTPVRWRGTCEGFLHEGRVEGRLIDQAHEQIIAVPRDLLPFSRSKARRVAEQRILGALMQAVHGF